MSESALPLPLEAKPRQIGFPAQGGALCSASCGAVAQAAYSLRATSSAHAHHLRIGLGIAMLSASSPCCRAFQ